MNEENLENIANNSIMMVRHKIVFVGDVSVGKTSVMCRFTENKFNSSVIILIKFAEIYILAQNSFSFNIFK